MADDQSELFGLLAPLLLNKPLKLHAIHSEAVTIGGAC